MAHLQNCLLTQHSSKTFHDGQTARSGCLTLAGSNGREGERCGQGKWEGGGCQSSNGHRHGQVRRRMQRRGKVLLIWQARPNGCNVRMACSKSAHEHIHTATLPPEDVAATSCEGMSIHTPVSVFWRSIYGLRVQAEERQPLVCLKRSWQHRTFKQGDRAYCGKGGDSLCGKAMKDAASRCRGMLAPGRCMPWLQAKAGMLVGGSGCASIWLTACHTISTPSADTIHHSFQRYSRFVTRLHNTSVQC